MDTAVKPKSFFYTNKSAVLTSTPAVQSTESECSTLSRDIEQVKSLPPTELKASQPELKASHPELKAPPTLADAKPVKTLAEIGLEQLQSSMFELHHKVDDILGKLSKLKKSI